MGAPLPAHLVPGGEADSAGFPWQGRTFEHHETAFADDDGSAPAEFIRAVQAVRDGVRALTECEDAVEQLAALASLAEAHSAAIVTCASTRFLIPLIAKAGAFGRTPEGKLVEKSQELSIVTVEAPDGRTAMPIFSSVDAMQSWNPLARPIPVPGPQVALAAAQEATDLVIVDPGQQATQFVVRRPALEAFALGEPRLPSWADPGVIRAFERSIVSEPSVRSVVLAPGDPTAELAGPETIVALTLVAGLAREALTAMTSRLQATWAADALIGSRVDSIAVQLRSE